MTPPLIKICGLSTPETVDAVAEAGADMIGFVFFPKSPRNVSTEAAAHLAEPVRGKVQIVALTVNASNETLEDIVSTLKPDLLQLHGSESPERCAEVREIFKTPVMKAFGISSKDDLDAVTPYDRVVDRLLFDAKPPKDANRPGGNGVSFDWHLLEDLKLDTPYMLSGGLTIENVADALRITRAPGVDVSSGVEREKGVKDVALIKEFVQRARTALS
ncbi:phosphoribosylanthranilate isomerase [Pseudovibrio sp. SPO723]|uniref:phosphoribosylanthranilate isomerase n=1 Tax=Nesiotobacter zosterae TaxID=392721 RepID=UPI0029C411AB|nr:phosphoribosylanthranilate isomerase [Pseudovibrio sp. SPO723]MDX5595103.1 phosphoribosylanthranilate isomerase [Pseudovibrio sp. SPO723]